jgi:hypothetical protein
MDAVLLFVFVAGYFLGWRVKGEQQVGRGSPLGVNLLMTVVCLLVAAVEILRRL